MAIPQQSPPIQPSSALDPASSIAHRVGDRVIIEGELRFDGPVLVDGMVTGEVGSTELLVIGETGCVDGQVVASTVIVEGTVHGKVGAVKQLVIRDGGRVLGEISTPSLAVEDGAIFEGACQMEAGRTEAKASRKGHGKGKGRSKEPGQGGPQALPPRSAEGGPA